LKDDDDDNKSSMLKDETEKKNLNAWVAQCASTDLCAWALNFFFARDK